MISSRKQSVIINILQRPRRSTIISPTRYIHGWHWHALSALVLVACLLAFVAGYVNTICIVNVFQLPLTALTGSTSKMAIVLAQGRLDSALHFFLLILSFVLGSFISAGIIGGSSFRIQRHYGLVLLLEAIALGVGSFFEDVRISLHPEWERLTPSVYLISLGCGLQNGMCTTYSGAVIRTTHVTGTLTDIGLIIGQAIFHKRTRKHLWKLKILVPLYLSFSAGAIVGWRAFQLLRHRATLIPCVIVGCLSLGHIVYCRISLNFNPHKTMPTVNEETDEPTRLSEALPIAEVNQTIDRQSSNTDQQDGDDEQVIPEDRLDYQRLTTPFITPATHSDLDGAKQTDVPAFTLHT